MSPMKPTHGETCDCDPQISSQIHGRLTKPPHYHPCTPFSSLIMELTEASTSHSGQMANRRSRITVTRVGSDPEGQHDYHWEAKGESSNLVCTKQNWTRALEQEKPEDHEGNRHFREQEAHSWAAQGHWRAGCPAWRTHEQRVGSSLLSSPYPHGWTCHLRQHF